MVVWRMSKQVVGEGGLRQQFEEEGVTPQFGEEWFVCVYDGCLERS